MAFQKDQEKQISVKFLFVAFLRQKAKAIFFWPKYIFIYLFICLFARIKP